MNTPPGDSDPRCLHLAVRVEAPFRANLEGSEVLAAGHVPGDGRAVDAGGHQRAQDNAHVDHAAGLDLREAPGDTEPGKGCFPHGLFHWDQGTPGEGAQFCPTHPTAKAPEGLLDLLFHSNSRSHEGLLDFPSHSDSKGPKGLLDLSSLSSHSDSKGHEHLLDLSSPSSHSDTNSHPVLHVGELGTS